MQQVYVKLEASLTTTTSQRVSINSRLEVVNRKPSISRHFLGRFTSHQPANIKEKRKGTGLIFFQHPDQLKLSQRKLQQNARYNRRVKKTVSSNSCSTVQRTTFQSTFLPTNPPLFSRRILAEKYQTLRTRPQNGEKIALNGD